MTERESQITFRSTHMEQELIKRDQGQLQSADIESKTQKKPERLSSLDILRGLTMFGMILVDCKGPDTYWFIRHAAWDGLTPADLVFPSFLFILRMAVPLALSKNKPIGVKSIIRIIALFLIGVLINLIDEKFEWLRIPGILQRMSICYMLVVIIHVTTRYGDKNYRYIGALIATSIGLIYLTFMLSFEDQSKNCFKMNLTKPCNFGGIFDSALLGASHVVKGCDPQGIFTSFSAFLNAYIGYNFALMMMDFKGNTKKILFLWVATSLILGVIAYPLTFLMPLNKRLWSISFVFLTSGITGLSLAFVTFFIDVLGKTYAEYGKVINKITTPFLWLGMNPLAIYVLMQLVQYLYDEYIIINGSSLKSIFEEYVFQTWTSKAMASCLVGIFFVIVWTIVAGVLYRKKIFIKL